VAWLGIGIAVVSLLGWMVAAGALAVRGAASFVAGGTLDDAECADLPAGAREALDRTIMRVTPPSYVSHPCAPRGGRAGVRHVRGRLVPLLRAHLRRER